MYANTIMGENMQSRDLPRKRVARACDRCRLKKGKCDGKEQCAKCLSADVMCIYTDRKPPQHKLISPAIAEALQSENLTLKKATIIIFKQLVDARQGQFPSIRGVDWSSEKVASGKSGRALNYIISQEAKVDNRITNEEITNYDSDSAVTDGMCALHPDSPPSQHASPTPRSAVSAEDRWSAISAEPAQPHGELMDQFRAERRMQEAARYYISDESTRNGVVGSGDSSGTPFLDPHLFRPPRPITTSFSNSSTPPNTLEIVDYFPPTTIAENLMHLQWSPHAQPSGGMVLPPYSNAAHQHGRGSGGSVFTGGTSPSGRLGLGSDDPPDLPWTNIDFYQISDHGSTDVIEKHFSNRVYDNPEVTMYGGSTMSE